MAMEGIRERLRRNSAVTIGMATALILVALGATCYEVMAFRNTDNVLPSSDFFTIDDGQTFFEDSTQNVPPFDYEGKQAVRACIYQCGGHKFVGYLERYTPPARLVIMASKDPAQQKPAAPGQPPAYVLKLTDAQVNGRDVKRPGSGSGVGTAHRDRMAAISTVTCPPGLIGKPQLVRP